MKEIKAIIRSFKLDDVITALIKIEDIPGLTISEIKGFGKTKGRDSKSKEENGFYNYVNKVKIEIVVKDSMVEEIVNTIRENAFTGNPGDGKIFIIDVTDVVKIRTNIRGENAI